MIQRCDCVLPLIIAQAAYNAILEATAELETPSAVDGAQALTLCAATVVAGEGGWRIRRSCRSSRRVSRRRADPWSYHSSSNRNSSSNNSSKPLSTCTLPLCWHPTCRHPVQSLQDSSSSTLATACQGQPPSSSCSQRLGCGASSELFQR